MITRHGGVATFAEAVSKLQPQDTETQGTFQVERSGTSPERWRGLSRIGLFEEVSFESGQELSAGDGERRLGGGTGARSVKEPKRWREGFPEPWNDVMEAAVRQFGCGSWRTTEC